MSQKKSQNGRICQLPDVTPFCILDNSSVWTEQTTINGLESPVDQQQQRHHSTTQPSKNATKTASSSRSSTEAAAPPTSTTRAAGNSTNSVLPPVLHHLVQLFDEIIATTDRVAATALTPSPFLVDAAKMPASINPGMVTAEVHTYLPII